MIKNDTQSELSVVVPLYNEAGSVAGLHKKIVSACHGLGMSFEVIFVDDGSHDDTLAVAKTLAPLTLVVFRKNFGQTAAFDAGFKEAHGKIIITMDGDLQNDPNDITLLLQKMDEGYDVVSGWRYKRRDTFMKRFLSRGANILRKALLHDSIHDSGCSLKAYKAETLASLNLFGEMHRFIPALLEMDGWTIGEVKVSHHARTTGKTKYNWRRSIKGFVDMVYLWFIRSYGARPVHFFGGAGLFCMFVGIALILWMLVEKLFLDASLSERIWPLMGVFLFMLGVQFFVFGLVVDMLMKNFYKARGRMNYTVKGVLRR